MQMVKTNKITLLRFIDLRSPVFTFYIYYIPTSILDMYICVYGYVPCIFIYKRGVYIYTWGIYIKPANLN